jgi:acyl dehydratase
MEIPASKSASNNTHATNVVPASKFIEDLAVGMVFTTQAISIDAPAIREFARQFDPQPYHLDREAAEASLFGGLCASGWHVCAVMMRLLSDCMAESGVALVGNDQVPWLQWRKPVFEGDLISATITVSACDNLSADDLNGSVSCKIVVHNQNDETVMKLLNVLSVAKRSSASTPTGGADAKGGALAKGRDA